MLAEVKTQSQPTLRLELGGWELEFLVYILLISTLYVGIDK